jgi:hypothetical protein
MDNYALNLINISGSVVNDEVVGILKSLLVLLTVIEETFS